jgi:hypothetical protein
MNSIAALLSSRAGEAGIFVAAVVFTVSSTVLFDAWVTRGANAARSRAVGVTLVLVFLCMAAGGIADYVVVGKPGFISLSLFLDGAAGLTILPTVMLRRGKDRELRRVAAHDL